MAVQAIWALTTLLSDTYSSGTFVPVLMYYRWVHGIIAAHKSMGQLCAGPPHRMQSEPQASDSAGRCCVMPWLPGHISMTCMTGWPAHSACQPQLPNAVRTRGLSAWGMSAQLHQDAGHALKPRVQPFAKVPMPEDVAAFAAAKRAELVERVAEVDEELGELFLEEAPIDAAALRCRA